MNEKKIPLVVIVGPTAVGKTETALILAERMQCEIVSSDSRLFYRGMDIGTAKPTLAERQRVPHHLIDVTDPDQTWSLAHFQAEAQRVILDIYRRANLPFLVGGTGQYLRAVSEGWSLPHQEPNPRLRQLLESWGNQIGFQDLHAKLAIIDPQAAEFIDASNVRRTIRALEVIFMTGRRFSEQRQRGESPYNLLTLGLTRPRPELYERIDTRIQLMLASGWLEEVRGLLARGYSPELPSMSAIGYKQLAAHLRGELTLEEAVVQMKRLTRVFVRRQANWFSESDPQIHWFRSGEGAAPQMETLVRQFLEEQNQL